MYGLKFWTIIFYVFTTCVAQVHCYLCLEVCDCFDANRTIAYCVGRNLKNIPASNLTSLEHVDLSDNKLTHIQESEWENYTSVIIMDLSDNNIRELQETSFRRLVNLEYLHLSNNQISHLPVSIFRENNALEALYLSNNPLVIPSEGAFIESNSLIHLDLSFCNLSTLPEEMFLSLPQLDVLEINGNPIISININTFERLKNLRYIHMRLETNVCKIPNFNETLRYFDIRKITYFVPSSCSVKNKISNTKPFVVNSSVTVIIETTVYDYTYTSTTDKDSNASIFIYTSTNAEGLISPTTSQNVIPVTKSGNKSPMSSSSMKLQTFSCIFIVFACLLCIRVHRKYI
ncbi:hypothetical protein C0J52_03458 [Blattella germanica]|nr:hypothetical protein C0J52_03458 [Blattella germanica]